MLVDTGVLRLAIFGHSPTMRKKSKLFLGSLVALLLGGNNARVLDGQRVAFGGGDCL